MTIFRITDLASLRYCCPFGFERKYQPILEPTKLTLLEPLVLKIPKWISLYLDISKKRSKKQTGQAFVVPVNPDSPHPGANLSPSPVVFFLAFFVTLKVTHSSQSPHSNLGTKKLH